MRIGEKGQKIGSKSRFSGKNKSIPIFRHAESESELLFEIRKPKSGRFCACALEKRQNRLNIAFFRAKKANLYRFLGMLNPNLSSSLKPEVEIRAFVRLRCGKTAKLA